MSSLDEILKHEPRCADPECSACPGCSDALCTICLGDECDPPCPACGDTGRWGKQALKLLISLKKGEEMGYDSGKHVQTGERPNGEPPVNNYSPSHHVDVSSTAVSCCFCGKSRVEVAAMIASDGRHGRVGMFPPAICNECISLCFGLLSKAMLRTPPTKDEVKA